MKTLFFPSTLVRSLSKIIYVCFVAGLLACEQVTVAPQADLVHITTDVPTVDSTATVDINNPKLHIEPQPKKADQTYF